MIGHRTCLARVCVDFGTFGAEGCVRGTPHQNRTFCGIVLFKHPHTGYPKPLQRYARLGRPVRTRDILAFCISKTPILCPQKHCCWHIWCRGMGVWGPTSKPHEFWPTAPHTLPTTRIDTFLEPCKFEIFFPVPSIPPTIRHKVHQRVRHKVQYNIQHRV